jgi:hypothetical protein
LALVVGACRGLLVLAAGRGARLGSDEADSTQPKPGGRRDGSGLGDGGWGETSWGRRGWGETGVGGIWFGGVVRGVQKVSMAPRASESRMPQLINSSVRSVGVLS